MEPVKSSATSNSCGETIGSNCVEWSGGNLCSADLCRGNTTLTDVITAMDRRICGDYPTSSCYTGAWVDFTTSIPVSGTGTGVTWSISGFGTGENGQTENHPMYKWTREGNLELRGSFKLLYGTSIDTGHFVIPLVTIPTTCFPANWNASQTILTSVECFSQNDNKVLNIFFRGQVQLIYPTGQLVLLGAFTSPVYGGTHNNYIISFGGTTFNIA